MLELVQKKLQQHSGELNLLPEQINAILVTHEHIDHTKSLATLSNKYNIPIYSNEKTWKALDSISSKISNENKKYFKILQEFEIGDFKIFPFPIPHDAADPCAFNIYNNNKKISIATDIGHISEDLINHLQNSTSIFLESNYDPEILKYSSYPYPLKKRISGDNGHLSNIMAGKTLATLYNSGLKNALLIHLSKENNFPELAYETVYNEISECKDLSLTVAPRDNPSKLFEVS